MQIILYVALLGLGLVIVGLVLSVIRCWLDNRQGNKQRVKYIEIPESDIFRTTIYETAQLRFIQIPKARDKP